MYLENSLLLLLMDYSLMCFQLLSTKYKETAEKFMSIKSETSHRQNKCICFVSVSICLCACVCASKMLEGNSEFDLD